MKHLVSLLMLMVLLASCDGTELIISPIDEPADEVTRPDGWDDETHSNDVEPNYDVVFAQDRVKRIDIKIDAADWDAMLANMTELYGEAGTGRGGPGGQRGGGPRPEGPPPGDRPPGDRPPGDRPPGDRPPRDRPPGGPGGGGPATENPMWVAATIEFEDATWTHVGVRFKGNSTLRNRWSSGSLRLPFKFDFDEFEDDYPEIDNQRFYGFKQLSLSNNVNDPSLMRDTITSDIIAEAGLAAAETATYEVYVDNGNGEGPVHFGLYTVIEVVDDTVVTRVFGNDDGNIYEADGPAVTLAEGTLAGLAESFEKENNSDDADWSDIERLYTILHSDSRLSDPQAWKAELEAIFDVDAFLKWLAINTVIENWDTYGLMTHNFYLYNNPETGLITWIPWDHNEALAPSRRGRMTLSLDSVGEQWPLIHYLLVESDYKETYVNNVRETIATVFEPEKMVAEVEARAAVIAPHVVIEDGSASYESAVEELITHIYERVSITEEFLTAYED